MSKEQFSGLSDLPKNLLSLQDRGLQIEFVDGDMRSHKKYLYAMRQFPKDNIITIDDDVIYRSDFIQSFVEMSKKFPHCIIGNRCKVTSSSKDYCYNHMRDAKNEDALVPREDLLSIGASGVLYPPDALFEDFDNEILIKKMCFTADDIWLHFMAKIKQTKTVFTNYYQNHLYVLFRNNVSLREVNYDANQLQINSLIAYYQHKEGKNFF